MINFHENHTATLHSGKSLSSAVYSDWPYLNAKIVIYSEFTSIVKEKVVSLHSKNYG